MDFANRGNRPNNTQQSQPSVNQEQPTSTFEPPKKARGSKLDFAKLSSVFMLFMATILVFVLVLGLVFIRDGKSESELIQSDNYQAVFLDSADGQVYFGKLDVYNKNLYRLTDIYYVRVENPIQPQGTETQQPNISLAKLGNELHGPQDVMFIARERVLYWENLKDDGQVVTAITEFKANGGETSQQTQTPAQQQATPAAEDTTPAAGTQPEGTPAENDTPADPVDPTLP
jgi:hypothetical protein